MITLENEEIEELRGAENPEKELLCWFGFMKKRGWIPYSRTQKESDGLLGNVLEDLIGISENNLKEPDYKGIEIKTHKVDGLAPLTLFNEKLTFPTNASSLIKNLYGIADAKSPEHKKLNTRIKMDGWNTHRAGYGYKLELKNDKLYIAIKSIENDEILRTNFYWKVDKIRQTAEKKIKNLAYITGSLDKVNKKVKFNEISLFCDFNFDKFINSLKLGDSYFEFRMGVYGSGNKKGKAHDHGSAFRINPSKINSIFDKKITK